MKWLTMVLVFALGWVKAEPLKVATDVWPPFRMLNEQGQLHGYDIEVLEEISRRTQLKFEIQSMPWARALKQLELGRVDLMVGLAKTPERAKYTDYLNSPYKTCRPSFYGQPQFAKQVRSYQDLSAFRIGWVTNSAYFTVFDQDNGLNKIETAREEQLLAMANRGNIELFIGTDCQVDFELNKRLDLNLAKAPWQPKAAIELFYGFSRANALDQAYRSIETTLDEMHQDGFLADLNQHYFGQ